MFSSDVQTKGCLYVDVPERSETGWSAITHQECLDLHACYDESIVNVPHCFEGITEGNTCQ